MSSWRSVWAGWPAASASEVWFLAALVAPLLTAMWGVVARLLVALAPRPVPHGPSMCVATAAAAGLALLVEAVAVEPMGR